MPNYTQEAIAARLNPAVTATPRRSVMLNIPEELVDQLELLSKVMTELSGKKTTRNMLIIEAVECMVAECTEQDQLSGIDFRQTL